MKWKVPDQEERNCAKNCQASKLNREDAMDHRRWKKKRKDD